MPPATVQLRRFALLTLVAAALVAFWAPHAHAAEPGVVSDLNWGIPAADQERTVSDLREMGTRWVRLHVGWKDFEQLKGVYNTWNLVNTGIAIDQARSTGANVILMVYDAPAWASGSSTSNVPRNPADYGDFVSYLASYYRGKVAAYEIWNEQNYQRFWSTGPNASAYTALLKAAYAGIKTTDPGALVVFGGLSRNDFRFVEEAYAAGAKGFFDVMAVHPYPDCGRSPDWIYRYDDGRIGRGAYLGYREVRASMLARGDDKPIWFTELGWSTATTTCDPGAGRYVGGVSESTQADYVKRAFELASQDPYIGAFLYYNFRNNYFDRDANEIEARYGLLRTDFSRKPAFYAMKGVGQTAPPADTTPPETTIASGPSGSTTSTTATFSFTASEPGGFACSLDGAAFASCSSPRDYAGLTVGSHTFRVWASDAAGNADATPAERTWTVEASLPPPANAAPLVQVTSPADGSTFWRTLIVEAAASDDKGVARVEFWLNDKLLGTDTSAPYSRKSRISSGYEGRYAVTAIAYDAEGLASKHTVYVTRTR